MNAATVYYHDEALTLYHGDCLDVLAALPEASIAAIVTDPPYGLEFMGQGWDAPWQEPGINADASFAPVGFSDGRTRLPRPTFTGSTNPSCLVCGGKRRGRHDGTAVVAVCACADGGRFPNVRAVEMRAFGHWCRQWADQCLRVLTPGGHLLAFGGTRTWHRLSVALEDAGFEIRDSIAWLYGNGFPKSLNVAGAIDREAGHVGAVVGVATMDVGMQGGHLHTGRPRHLAERVLRAPSPAATRWHGWGTALKPAFEPIVVARKPLAGTVAATVTSYGTGALHIDACRVPFRDEHDEHESKTKNQHADFGTAPGGNTVYGDYSTVPRANYDAPGRWPPNVLIDDAVADDLDRRSPVTRSRIGTPRSARPGHGWGLSATGTEYDDEGGPSRFFPRFPAPDSPAALFPAWRYQPKAPTAERPRDANGIGHPTVKPVELMRWLVRLVTPPGGTVLDPFLGSAATAQACLIEGVQFIGIEKEQSYLDLALHRLSRPIQLDLFGAGIRDPRDGAR